MKKTTKQKTIGIVSIEGMGDFDKKKAKKIADWLRSVADQVENDYKKWTNETARFGYYEQLNK